MLRVDFHTADGITNGRRLAFHDSLPRLEYSFILSALQFDAPLAYPLVPGGSAVCYEPGSRQPSLSVPEIWIDVVLYLVFRHVTVMRRYRFEP